MPRETSSFSTDTTNLKKGQTGGDGNAGSDSMGRVHDELNKILSSILSNTTSAPQTGGGSENSLTDTLGLTFSDLDSASELESAGSKELSASLANSFTAISTASEEISEIPITSTESAMPISVSAPSQPSGVPKSQTTIPSPSPPPAPPVDYSATSEASFTNYSGRSSLALPVNYSITELDLGLTESEAPTSLQSGSISSASHSQSVTSANSGNTNPSVTQSGGSTSQSKMVYSFTQSTTPATTPASSASVSASATASVTAPQKGGRVTQQEKMEQFHSY